LIRKIKNFKKYTKNPVLSKIIKNISWLLFDKLLRMGIGVIFVVLLARHLGPNEFGLYNYITSLVALFLALASLGLNAIVVKELVENNRDVKILKTSFYLRLVGGFISYILLICTVFILKPNDDLSKYLVVILGLRLFFTSSDIFKYWFESQINSKYTVIVENSVFLFFATLKIILIYYKVKFEIFIYLLALESVFIFFGMLYVFLKTGNSLDSLRFDLDKAKSLLSQSWPLVISSFAWVLYTKTDQIMIGQFIGNTEVGFYAAASRLSEIASFLPTIIVFSIVPSIIKLRTINEELYIKRFQQLYYIVTTLMVFLAILVTTLSTPIIRIIYGNLYSSAASVLVIQFWIVVAIGLAIVSGKYLVNSGQQKITMKRHIVGVLFNIPLNYFLIPIYGIDGAAVASLISLVFSNYVFDYFSKSTRLIFIQKTKSLCFYWLFSVFKRKNYE
jgi:O-antigen/teichoic acid export membrane protein